MGTCIAVVLLITALSAGAQLTFEAEDVSSPADAWAKDTISDSAWNLWSTDKDAQKKWSGGVVLQTPLVMQDRQRPEDGAPPLHTVITDIPAGVYTVMVKCARVLGISKDGQTWERYSGGPLFEAVRVGEGGSIEFWVDDRFAMPEESARGSGYYDCVYLFPQRSFKDGIPNAGFEAVEDGKAAEWTWWSREASGQAVAATADVHDGEYAVHITHDAERDWAYTNGTRLTVTPGADLCVKAWMKGPKGAADVTVNAVGYGNGERVSWTVGRGRASMTGAWVQAKGYFQVPSDVDAVQLRFTGQGKTDVLLDSVSLTAEKQTFPDKPPVQGWASARVREPMGRGAVALPRADGSVYISWRLLRDDPQDIGFDVFRQDPGKQPTKLNDRPIVQTCDFVDTDGASADSIYSVRQAGPAAPPAAVAVRAEAGDGQPYVRLALDQPDTAFQKVGVADLNGDGAYDYVIKQPNQNIDPWVKYWYKSPETYKLEGYLSDGTFLWRIDLGWGIERGIWYSPYIVADLTGDGRAEVAAKVGVGDPRDEDGRVTSGEEFVVVWDGMTGKEITRAPWPERDAFSSYNYASRNQIAIAYLDGKTPCLLTLRGTYTRMIVHAYQLKDGALEPLWQYDNDSFGGRYWGQGAHSTMAADIDGDGRDEVILGSAVIDDNGVPLWSTGRGHPDAHYLTDVTPDNPGLEIAYVMETRQRRNGGLNVVDARTGKELWALDTPTSHVHGKGMCADVDPAIPGMEVYGADADGHQLTENRWLFSGDGKLLRQGTECTWGFSIPTVYWDADLQKEVARGKIMDFDGTDVGARISGSQRLKADILGDWREEIITSINGELRIYSTTIPAMDRRVCLMQDPVYRLATAMNAMGYTQDPTLSYNPVHRSPNLNLTFMENGEDDPLLRVVASAPQDQSLAGRVTLEPEGPIRLSETSFAVDVPAGSQVVKTITVAAAGTSRLVGAVAARLQAGDLTLRGRTRVRLAGGFLTTGVLAQAEDFTEQQGGEVQIRDDKAKTMNKAISHWDDEGHALGWTFTVTETATYELVLRYCAPHSSRRQVSVDGGTLSAFTLPTTGGFGDTPADWEHAVAAPDGKPLRIRLEKGPHTVRLVNADGQGCNLDYIALVPVNE